MGRGILGIQVAQGIPVVVVAPRQVCPVPLGPGQQDLRGHEIRISFGQRQSLAHGLAEQPEQGRVCNVEDGVGSAVPRLRMRMARL